MGRVTLTSRAFHHDQLGPFCARTGRADRHRDGAADELRRRGRRIGDQGRPQVGVPGQGRAGEPGADHHRGRQLPRPHADHRLVLRRSGRPRRLRPLHARLRHGEVRRPAGDGGGDHARTPRPSCWSRSRARPACWCRRPVTWPGSGGCATRTTCCSSPTRSSPGSAAPGSTLALDHEGVRADLYTLGKALGGGIMPVSAVVGRRDVLGVLQPGQHGSTFGGNPLACAIGRAVIALLRDRRDAGPVNRSRRAPARQAG